MKILQLHREVPYPPTSGGETRVWKTAQKFTEFGKVIVAAPWSGNPDFPQDIDTYKISPIILNSKLLTIYIWVVSMFFGARNTYTRLFSYVIYNQIVDSKPDLILSESPQMALPASRLASETDCKFLMNHHNCYYSFVSQILNNSIAPDLISHKIVKGIRTYEEYCMEKADIVIFQSDEDVELYDYEGKYRVIPNGTDITEEDEKKNIKSDSVFESDFVCVFLGSYDYSPNLEAAQMISEDIAPRFDDVKFVLVGRDPPKNTSRNVVTTGYIDDLSNLLDACDVALCPLKTGSGTKLKILDYLASGLPVVTTEIGSQGIPIRDGVHGVIASHTDDFESAIRQLKRNPDKRYIMSNNAKELAKDYAWENLLAEYESALDELALSR